MRGRIAAFVFICAAAVVPANARAVSVSGTDVQHSCRVVAGEKLLARAGGGEAVCGEVKRAIAVAAPKARYKVEIKVLPRSRLSAALVVNGRTLPEEKFAVMDSELDRNAIHRFAEGVASAVAEAIKSQLKSS
jgi:hypothetical protein